MITGMTEKNYVQMLVDTGSAVTILREVMWRRPQEFCHLHLEAPTRSVDAANGEELSLLGQSEVSMSIRGLTRKHTVLVAKGLTQEFLLSADFLTQHGCDIDLMKMTLLAGGKFVSVCTQSHCNGKDLPRPVCHVALSDTIVVLEYCQM